MANFDPNTFMQQTVDQPLETEYRLCPVGEYQAMIQDFDGSAFRTNDFTYSRGPKQGQPGSMTSFDCPFVINDARVQQELNRDTAIVAMPCILDLDANGGIDFGVNKNIKLGQIRAAVGQNNPGPWSPANLRGAGPVMVKVEHIDFTRRDGTQGKRAEVTRVAPIRT